MSDSKESKGGTDLEKALEEAAQAVETEKVQKDGVEVDLSVASDDDDNTESKNGAEAAPEAPPNPPPATEKALNEARQKLEKAHEENKKQAEELKNRWLRAAADLENYKKRAKREREETVRFANERLLKDFLPIIDDLDRSVEVVEQSSESSADAKTLLEGVKLVQKKMIDQLKKHSVEVVESEGKGFDPVMHEAVQQVHSDVPAGGVAFEVRRGFYLNGRLLRAAMVAVSLGPENPSDEAKKDEAEAAKSDDGEPTETKAEEADTKTEGDNKDG